MPHPLFGSQPAFSLAIFGVLAFAAVFASAAERAKRSSIVAAMESITTAELRRHVDVLSGDTFEGREAGSRGGRAAASYIVDQLRRYHLQPAGVDAGYYQPFGAGYRNVLAMLEGSDATLKQQVVIVGAHYDHVGYGTRRNSYGPLGLIHNGADDNASGTSVLLELAEAMTRLPQPPRRTILFVFWDGEEQGLIGSQHYIDNPTVRLDRIPLIVNMDMVGRLRNETLYVFGTRTTPGLRRMVSNSNETVGLRLDFPWELKKNSDHHSFFSRGVPVLMLHTGLHDDYHRPSDDAEKVDTEGMTKVAHLLFTIVYDLANTDTLAPFRAASRQEAGQISPYERIDSSPPPGRLGIEWTDKKADAPGVIVSAVRSDSPAERAKLQPGDRIVRCDGQEIADGSQLRSAIVVAPKSILLTVERTGEAKPLELLVELTGKPQRFGVTCWEDDAEPKSLIVATVTPDSPAGKAGIEPGDRIWQLAGSDIDGNDTLRRLAAQHSGPTDVVTERRGRVRKASVELPPVGRGEVPREESGQKNGAEASTAD